MTAFKKPKQEIKPYVSSRQWAEERIVTVKKLQDEYLDMYCGDKKESTRMLKLLNKLVEGLEKKL